MYVFESLTMITDIQIEGLPYCVYIYDSVEIGISLDFFDILNVKLVAVCGLWDFFSFMFSSLRRYFLKLGILLKQRE